MAVGVYGLSTLQDNWLEDRFAPKGSLNVTSQLHRKAARAVETDLAYIGDRYDVLARISRMPFRESYAIPDDGFCERVRTSSVDFANPRERPEFSGGRATAPALITTANAPVRPPETRELPGPQSGFGASLPRHEGVHDRRFWNTTRGDFFGEGIRSKLPKMDPADPDLRSAGVSTEHEEARQQGLRVGKLCGEAYNETDNPAANSRTQRSWLYEPDASLRNIHLGGKRTYVPPKDNECSLPIGEGSMSKVRADLKARNGRLYHTATFITKGKGHRSGISIFEDY